MSNVQSEKEKLDQLARLQQMKLNARLTALQSAQTIMALPGFASKLNMEHTPHPGNSIDSICLLAMAQEIESYILGTIEDETKKALEERERRLTAPKIVRP